MQYKEFVESRRSYLGASDAPVIMGVSPWKTKIQLWEEKLGLSKDEDSFVKKRGRDMEPEARDSFALYTGHMVNPALVVHDTISYLCANLDGLSSDGSVAVEIKCPGKDDHATAQDGKIPEKYFPQLQQQLAVTSLEKIYYYSYRDGEGICLEVARDDEYIDKLYDECARFWACVENLSPPEMEEKDVVERSDDAWLQAAAEYAAAERDQQVAKERAEAAREALIALAGDEYICSLKGGGIKLQKIIRKGNVDYSKIEILKGVDIENYRKPPIQSWRLSIEEA